MHCLADSVASGGKVFIGDTDLTALSDKAMTMLRRDRIGFVFQAFNLVPTLTAKRTSRCRSTSPAGPSTPNGSTPWWPGCRYHRPGWDIFRVSCRVVSNSAWRVPAR